MNFKFREAKFWRKWKPEKMDALFPLILAFPPRKGTAAGWLRKIRRHTRQFTAPSCPKAGSVSTPSQREVVRVREIAHARRDGHGLINCPRRSNFKRCKNLQWRCVLVRSARRAGCPPLPLPRTFAFPVGVAPDGRSTPRLPSGIAPRCGNRNCASGAKYLRRLRIFPGPIHR